ncbi:MAG: HD domain-containing protein [Myxococcaceae bacterium]
MATPEPTTLTLAVIDLGSNGCRCLITEVKSDRSRRVLLDEREGVKLGESIFKSGELTEAAMDRAVTALKRFMSEAQKHNAITVRAVATAAVREAGNKREFMKRVQKEVGLQLDVISGTEEARLIALGVLEGAPERQDSLLIDIGGGSAEVSAVKGTEVKESFSLQLGAIRLTEMFLRGDPPKDKEVKLLNEHIDDVLSERLGDRITQKRRTVIGTAGTIGALEQALRNQGRGQPGTIERKDLSKLYERLCRMDSAERKKVVEEKRIDTVIAGAAVLVGIMDYLGLDEMQVSKKGLRDGLMLDLIQRIGMPLPYVEAQEKAMREGVKAFGRRCLFREEHSEHVTTLALSLFDQLHGLHKLKPEKRTLLYAAGMLHDVGLFVSYNKHHKHSAYLIQNAELPGFTESEKDVIAQIARYHRKNAPKPKHEGFVQLVAEDQDVVRKLAGMLRLADALDRAHKRHVQFVTSKVDGKKCEITVHSRQGADLELWAAEPKSELLEEALGVKISLKAEP